MIAGLIHRCTLQKRYQKQQLAYTDYTGTLTVGQTIEGGTSEATAVIEVVSTFIVLNTVMGTFEVGETATTNTGSITIVNQYAYANDSGEPEYYWADDQTSVPCRFYNPSGTMAQHDTGQLLSGADKVMFPPDVIINALDYRIVSTIPGFTGTFHLTSPMPRYGPGEFYDHIEYVLQVVPSP